MKSETKAPPDLRDRLLAAALAPAAFNICLFIVFMVFLKAWGARADFLFTDFLPSALGTSIAIVFVVVPAAVGFAVGTDGFVRFLGHSFYTHGEDERNLGMTLAIWATIIALAWLLSRAVR
jgi:hypothetical protein